MCFDAGWHGQAQRYTQMALRAAHSAEDRQVGANILGFAAGQAAFRGDGVAAEGLSRTALAGGRGALTPAVEGSVHLGLGRGRACLGDLSGAAASFDTAEALLASSDPEGEPDWIYWFTVGELHGIVGQTYLLAHEPETAVGHLHQGIEETGEEFARDRAAYLADMATAQVLNGDLDESRHTAERALEILSGDLNSGRVVELLTNYCGTLRAHNPRDAADFEERLAAYPRSPSQA